MTCPTKDLLIKFYGWLNFSLRTLLHYRMLATFGKPFDYSLVEEPWRVHEVLEKAVGRHNAELILHISRLAEEKRLQHHAGGVEAGVKR